MQGGELFGLKLKRITDRWYYKGTKYDETQPFDYNKPEYVESEPVEYNASDVDPFDTLEDESKYNDELGPEPIEYSTPTTTVSQRKGLWDRYDPR